MKVNLSASVLLDCGGEVTIQVVPGTDLDPADRAFLANLFRAFETRLVDMPPPQAMTGVPAPSGHGIGHGNGHATEIDHLRHENEELRKLVSAIPPGTPGWTPPPPVS